MYSSLQWPTPGTTPDNRICINTFITYSIIYAVVCVYLSEGVDLLLVQEDLQHGSTDRTAGSWGSEVTGSEVRNTCTGEHALKSHR